ncbi:membrane protein [Algimonas arctica]|uniref:Membrane protein n=1 Tax=Algimonas arctica TaxID=1479486 RepID=A0A8J3CNF3_9PROT|nr:SLC13 family permease [Algimonas arctica]GHA83695.1 membrane protein [Algimonas arctica]
MWALPEFFQMWAVFAIVAVGVYLYVSERFSIETTSVGLIFTLMLFGNLFTPSDQGLDSASMLSGFAAPALITIMALLVVGQGLFQTGALESMTVAINKALDHKPRRTLTLVFGAAFAVSMFMNNTPVVVMFIPVLAAMSGKMGVTASRYMMPLSFLCILAGMTTLIGSSTNLLVNDVLVRTTDLSLSFFTQFVPGMTLAAIGATFIVIAGPWLIPDRESEEPALQSTGQQYIAQIRVTADHPLDGVEPVAGLYRQLREVTVRMVQRGETAFLPPFEENLQSGDVLIIAATRPQLSALLKTRPQYLHGMLDIGAFSDGDASPDSSIMLSEAVVAPGSRMIGRNIEQIGFRRQTGCLVLGIQRRSRMIRKRMLDIRLEAGDILLLFGYEKDISALRQNRDLILLDWSTAELQDIRKAKLARIVFVATIALAALSFVPIEIAALGGAIGMIAAGCLNIRQAVRALDMRIFLLIGAAFAMGLALERTGGAEFIGNSVVSAVLPFGTQALIAAVFLIVAIFTNIISNSAAALLFAPIALSISEKADIDPIVMVLTVIFAANCSFATPIAYQTNLLVMGPGHYRFGDFARFGVPLILLLWVSYVLLAPYLFGL